MSRPRRGVVRWLKSTSNRTFVLYPALIAGTEWILRGGSLAVVPWGVPLLVWGYLQYRLVGRYRTLHGGGGPGLSVPPQRLVTQGPYALSRNPMYLGHLVFLAGLALTFQSWLGALLLAVHLPWFDARAREDEAQLRQLFGAEYEAYARRVRRWIPRLV